jgi:hypothetical protein
MRTTIAYVGLTTALTTVMGCPAVENCPKTVTVLKEDKFVPAAKACDFVETQVPVGSFARTPPNCADLCGPVFNECALDQQFYSAYQGVPRDAGVPCPNGVVRVTCRVVDKQDELGSCSESSQGF